MKKPKPNQIDFGVYDDLYVRIKNESKQNLMIAKMLLKAKIKSKTTTKKNPGV